MAKAEHTYSIRLTVDGGGKVKAELMDVGRTGDKALKKIETAGGRASLGLSRLTDRARSLGQRMKLLYGVIVAAGAVRGLREIVRLYADFEAGLIGVGKTADLSGTELASLGKDIDALSKRIPMATDELLAIAQSAGQLGVKGAGNILKFTETVAKLGTATDLGGNEAAIALARILNITGEAMGKVDVLGSVIVALGNNFAATESQIAEMATEIARGAAVFGVSSAQASALAAALAAVGVKSEVAGTSVGRVMRMMDAAIRSGGEHLEILTKITGRTAEEIKGLFRKDAVATFALFIEGLKRVSDAGGSTADVMAALGLADQRLLKTIPVLANRADLLAQALELANRETENATALNEEAARAFESLNNQTELMWNNIKSLARAIGEDLAPGVAAAVRELADLAGQAGVAYEQLKLLAQGDFNFEGLSLGSTRAIVEERRAELQEIARELKELGDVGFLDDPLGWGRKVVLERQLEEKTAVYRQWAAKLAWMQRDKRGKPGPTVDADSGSVEVDIKAAQDRARRIGEIEKDLQRQLFILTHEGADRIRAEYERLVAEMQTLIAPDASNLEKVGEIMAQAAAVRDARLAQLAAQEQEAARRRADANRKIVDGLRAERDELAMTDRAHFVSQALRRLSADATVEQRRQVRELAGALFDEQQAIEARNRAEEDAAKLKERGRALTESLRTAEEAYKAELAELNRLLNEGAISQETFARATEDAYDRMLSASREWSAGVTRALRDYGKEAGDAARQFEDVTSSALKASEDAWVEWARTGKLSVADFFSTLEEAALRAAWRLLIFKPMESFLEGLIGSISFDFFGSSSLTAPNNGAGLAPQYRSTAFAHGGGVVGVTPLAHRPVDPAVFENAPRFHSGGLVSGDVPVIARQGEVIGWPEQMREAFGSEVVVQVIDQRTNGAKPEVTSERGPDGRRIVRVLIRDEVNRGIAQGAFDQALGSAFGINRRGVPR